MKWEPWYEHRKTERPKLEISGPPCAFCKHWQPHVNFSASGEVSGVTCCVANDMHSDFSCFIDKQTHD